MAVTMGVVVIYNVPEIRNSDTNDIRNVVCSALLRYKRERHHVTD